jgi:basic membrane lipoprotein Med (substrate-binding protein (PBP1-ABC) superfamily)
VVLVAVTCALAGADCSLVVTASLKGALGAPCASDADCQASACQGGVCAKSCAMDIDCPAPTLCMAALCQVPLKVAALWSGVGVGGDGWTHAHKTGLDDTAQRLPYVRFGSEPYLFREDVLTSAQVQQGVDDYVAQGADVIVATSVSQRDDILKKADQYPRVKFLTCGGFEPNGRNAGSYFGRYEQGWYVGGRIAALRAKKRLGYIAPLANPGVARFINAFARGARSINPGIVLEVRWLGFWRDLHDARTYDYQAKTFPFATSPTDPSTRLYREELLAAQLIDDGCELVVHETDIQRSVSFIDSRLHGVGPGGQPVASMAVDIRDGCRADGAPDGAWFSSCLGAIYWNWAALYTDLFGQMHRGVWKTENRIDPLRADPVSSPFYFGLNPGSGIASEDLQSTIVQVAALDYRDLYAGPYEVTGQRDRLGTGAPDADQTVAAGESPSEDELARMCWFSKGIVEKADPNDPTSADVDAHVPDGVNGRYPPKADVLQYEKDFPFIDPDHDMNCPVNQ